MGNLALKKVSALAILAVTAQTPKLFADTILYSSGGFDDTSLYRAGDANDSVPGDLNGEGASTNFGAGSWQEFDNNGKSGTAAGATATIVTSPVASATQAIKVNRTIGGTVVAWSPDVNLNNAGNTPVVIDWNEYVTQSNASDSDFGPYFGVQARGPLGFIGAFGVDATTGFLVSTNSAGATILNSNGISFNQYHAFEFTINPATSQYTETVDGSVAFSGVSGQSNPVTAVYIMSAPYSTLDQASGTAYFDDFQIRGTSVPEPSSLILLAIGGMGLLRRRRTIAGATII